MPPVNCYVFSIYLMLSALVFVNPVGADEIDRSHFGNSELPIWSQLTPFETETLKRLELARAGDPDALLALYLVASGDLRDKKTYQQRRNQIDKWLMALQSELDQSPDLSAKAEALHIAMHEHFFNQASELAGYRAEQSQLSDLFKTRHFNCISSSMLYIVLARKLGIATRAVVLPSHVFVQLDLETKVEVETTTVNGYNGIHDQSYYNETATTWYADRDLAAPSFEAYQARILVSPYELGIKNMINQHTSPERMTYIDRMRLAELHAMFSPDDAAAQAHRLSYYTQEYADFSLENNFTAAGRLFDSIAPYLDRLSRQQQYQNLLRRVQAGRARTLLETGQLEAALRLSKKLLQDIEADITTEPEIDDYLFETITLFLEAKTQSQHYHIVTRVLVGIESQCRGNRICLKGLASAYSNWGERYWQDKRWQEAIEVYETYIRFDDKGQDTQVFRNNIENAYLNLAGDKLREGKPAQARATLNTCTEKLPSALRCRENLIRLKTRS